MKKSRFALVFAVALGAGFFATTALAQDAKQGSMADSPLAFANADKNGDGSLSRSEVPKELRDLRAHFDQYDANRDHRLSEGEYAGYLASLGEGACRNELHMDTSKCKMLPGISATGQSLNGFSNIPKVSNNPPKVPSKGGGM